MNSDRLDQSQPRPAADTNPAEVLTVDPAPGTLSTNGTHPVALVNLNVLQLVEAGTMLDQCQARYDKLSGICGTMRGGVFTELKRKVGHGHFLPILAQSFSKTRKTAAQDMRLWAEFCKCNPRVTFETLGRDLATTVQEIERSNIDLRHPLVRDIAGWVDGRTRYQLLLDFPGSTGGDTSAFPRKPKPTEEVLHDQTLNAWTLMIDELVDRTFGSNLYKVEWGRLTTKELADLDDRLYRVHQELADTLKARRAS